MVHLYSNTHLWSRDVDHDWKTVSGCVSSLQQSDYPYNENVPNIKIPMDIMEQKPFLGDKASDSE